MSRRMPKALGWHFDAREPVLDDEGRRTCRWCKGKLSGRRTSYCSDACSIEWGRRLRWGITRAMVLARAGYLCQKCGIDTRLIDPEYCSAQLAYADRIQASKDRKDSWRQWKPPVHIQENGEPYSGDYWRDRYVQAIDWCRRNKCLGKSPAEVDHVIPVAMGGDYHDMRNLVCLCRADHVSKTREDMGRIKEYKQSISG